MKPASSEGLHGFTAVAELKQLCMGDAHGGRRCGLHGFTAVAELKLREELLWLKEAVASPRLHRRGRIEAAHRIEMPCKSLRLHGFTAVAELKRLERSVLLLHAQRLHGFTAVAELKRRDLAMQRGDGGVSTASPPWPN